MSTIIFHCKTEKLDQIKKVIFDVIKNHYFTTVYPNTNVKYDDEGKDVYLARLEDLMISELLTISDTEDGFTVEFDSTEDAGFAITEHVYHTTMGYNDNGLTYLDPLFKQIAEKSHDNPFEAYTLCADNWVYEENEYSYDGNKLQKDGIVILSLSDNCDEKSENQPVEEPLIVESLDFSTSTFVLAGFEMSDEWNIKAAIESRGGTVKDRVTASVNYLVVPTLTTTNSKTKKAAELCDKGKKITTITLSECKKHMLLYDERRFGSEDALIAADYRLSIINGKITLDKYIGKNTDVVIPEYIGEYPVTALGTSCFASNPMSGEKAIISSIRIPGSIEIIPGRCFEYCDKLISAVLEEGVKVIEEDAFRECEKLTSLSIPKTINTIRKSAFHGCKSLKSIFIPAGVQTIESCITGCDSLGEIIVDSANEKYDSRDNCNAVIETSTNTLIIGCKSTVIPDTVKIIGDSAFSCLDSIVEIELPEGVTEIGNNAFGSCFNMKSVNLPQSIVKIGYYAFYFCRELKRVELPLNLTEIHVSVFGNCENLTELFINDKLAEIVELDNAWMYHLKIQRIYGSKDSIAKSVAEALRIEYIEI